jgi:hypothetical protein
MKLSYLDILLGTTMVFVIIYGVNSRSVALPEVEGTALVLRITTALNTDNQNVEEPSFTISYISSSGDRLEFQLDNAHHRITDYLFIDASQRQNGLITVHGQPDPGSTIEVVVERDVNQLDTSLFLHREFYIERLPNLKEVHDLIRWAEKGEGLILRRSSFNTIEFQQKVRDWNASVPLSIDNIRLKCQVVGIRNPVYATAWFEAGARALMVNELLNQNSTPLDPLLNNTNGRFRLACRRVIRHWEFYYGDLAVEFKAKTGRMSALDMPQSSVLPPAALDGWKRAMVDDNWGVWIANDMITKEIALPVICYWSYGGKPQFTINEWVLAGNSIKSNVVIRIDDER